MNESLPFKKSKTVKSPDEHVDGNPLVVKRIQNIATKPPAPAANPFQKMLAAKQKTLKNFLGDNQKAMRFMSSVMHCMEKVPELQRCTPQSVMGAFMEAAALGLFPGNASGDCYILPYAGKAQFQIGYRGLKTLAFRAGILSCGSDIVYKNDKYKEFKGTNPRIEHEAAEGERGEAVHAYAWAKPTEGHVVFKSMTKAEIMKIKALSPAKNSKYSPWNSKTDPMLWMWQKTAFKQMAKLIPTSEKMSRALHVDNVSERGGYFEDDGNMFEQEFVNEPPTIEEVKAKKAAMKSNKK